MLRKVSLSLFIVLVFVLLTLFLLVACEMVGEPQPTATPKAKTPVPTKGDVADTPRPPATFPPGYPTVEDTYP